MGFRFRKSIRIMPGVRLNLSKGGLSTSIGRPGATINIGKRGVRGTVGLPGSGLSYSEMLGRRDLTATGLAGGEGPSTVRGLSMVKIAFVIVVCMVVIWMLFGGSHKSPEKTIAPAPQAALDVAQAAALTPASTSTATVMANVNCRAEPRKAATMVENLSEGTSITALATRRGWTEVQTSTSRCWVVSDYIG